MTASVGRSLRSIFRMMRRVSLSSLSKGEDACPEESCVWSTTFSMSMRPSLTPWLFSSNETFCRQQVSLKELRQILTCSFRSASRSFSLNDIFIMGEQLIHHISSTLQTFLSLHLLQFPNNRSPHNVYRIAGCHANRYSIRL